MSRHTLLLLPLVATLASACWPGCPELEPTTMPQGTLVSAADEEGRRALTELLGPFQGSPTLTLDRDNTDAEAVITWTDDEGAERTLALRLQQVHEP